MAEIITIDELLSDAIGLIMLYRELIHDYVPNTSLAFKKCYSNEAQIYKKYENSYDALAEQFWRVVVKLCDSYMAMPSMTSHCRGDPMYAFICDMKETDDKIKADRIIRFFVRKYLMKTMQYEYSSGDAIFTCVMCSFLKGCALCSMAIWTYENCMTIDTSSYIFYIPRSLADKAARRYMTCLVSDQSSDGIVLYEGSVANPFLHAGNGEVLCVTYREDWYKVHSMMNIAGNVPSRKNIVHASVNVLNTGIAQLLDAAIDASRNNYSETIQSFIAMRKRYTTIARIIRILELKKGVFPELITHLFKWV
jgi:hypothetical protein